MSYGEDFPHNGIYKLENFVENVLHERASIRLDMKICNFEKWDLDIRTKTDNQGNVTFFPSIKCDTPLTNHQQYLAIYIYCKIININDDDQSIERWRGFDHITKIRYMTVARGMTMTEVMDEKNGWLDNGALSIELGIYVEFIQWKNGIRTFNFYDKTLECDDECNMITMDQQTHDKRFYSHKQLVIFHSTLINDEFKNDEPVNIIFYISKETDMDLLEKCLQIAHGVQLKLPYYEINKIISIAWDLKLSNVIRYCERQLIEMEMHQNEINVWHFYNAFTYNLNIYLKHLLKKKKSLEMMKLILRELNIQKMPSESMKLIIAKLVYNLF